MTNTGDSLLFARLVWAAIVVSACAEAPSAEATQERPGVCDSIAIAVPAGSHSSVALVRDTTLTDPMNNQTPWRRGCLLTLVDSAAFPSADSRADALNRWFDVRRWTPVIRYSADGPDGTMFAFSDRRIICIVRGEWDGGDDADSTYKPMAGTRWSVQCAMLAAEDTTQTH